MKYEISECIGSRLRGLSRKVDSIYRKHLQGAEITENQLSILMALSKTGEIEQIEIGRILNLERSSMSRNLVRLIDQGLILKKGAVNRPAISLTKKGRQKVKGLLPAWERSMEEVLGKLTKTELMGFNHFEKRLTE